MENNDKPLNGICIDGKFYETDRYIGMNYKCIECDLCNLCIDHHTGKDKREYCYGFPAFTIFRFSQSITDKINEK